MQSPDDSLPSTDPSVSDKEPYYVLLLRAPKAEVYTNEAGSPDKAELIARANRELMRGAGSALVVKVEFWEQQLTQGKRDLTVKW